MTLMTAALSEHPAGGELLEFLPDEVVAAAIAEARSGRARWPVHLARAITTPWWPPWNSRAAAPPPAIRQRTSGRSRAG